jgi:hypothetical protein
MLWMEGHHEQDFAHLWCAAPEGGQSALVASDPQRLDELETLLEDAYRCVASKRQLAQLEAERG